MAQFLPDKVLDRIFEVYHLSSYESSDVDPLKVQSEMADLCYVCKGWFDPAQRWLYRDALLVGYQQIESFLRQVPKGHDGDGPARLVVNLVVDLIGDEVAAQKVKSRWVGSSGADGIERNRPRRQVLGWHLVMGEIFKRCNKVRVLTVLNLKPCQVPLVEIPKARSPYLRQVNLRMEPIFRDPGDLDVFVLENADEDDYPKEEIREVLRRSFDMKKVVFRQDVFSTSSRLSSWHPQNRPLLTKYSTGRGISSNEATPEVEPTLFLHGFLDKLDTFFSADFDGLEFEWTGARGRLREGVVNPALVCPLLTEIDITVADDPIEDSGLTLNVTENDGCSLSAVIGRSQLSDQSNSNIDVLEHTLREFLHRTQIRRLPKLEMVSLAMSDAVFNFEIGRDGTVWQTCVGDRMLGSEGFILRAPKIAMWSRPW